MLPLAKLVVHLHNFLNLVNRSLMLNYVKTVLTKVSFDAKLFEKELRKAIEVLMGAEVQELKQWCYNLFGNEHQAILNRCFIVS